MLGTTGLEGIGGKGLQGLVWVQNSPKTIPSSCKASFGPSDGCGLGLPLWRVLAAL